MSQINNRGEAIRFILDMQANKVETYVTYVYQKLTKEIKEYVVNRTYNPQINFLITPNTEHSEYLTEPTIAAIYRRLAQVFEEDGFKIGYRYQSESYFVGQQRQFIEADITTILKINTGLCISWDHILKYGLDGVAYNIVLEKMGL